EAVINKLDYLEYLGITAIELMPIQEFDGNLSWGYNPNHYFAPDKAYGTPDMYKKFIDECHKRGIAVILDVVFNHATGQHPFAMLYWNKATSKTTPENPWFNVDAPHPYNVYHDFNHEFAGTRNYFKRVLQYWVSEYKIDGYRLDLTKGFTQNSSTESTAANYDQSRINILTDYYNAAKTVKSDIMFILEHFAVNSEETVLANEGMYLWRNANDAYSQSAMGYQTNSDFGAMNSIPRNWVGFAESHDEERNFFKAKKYGAGTMQTDSVARINRVPLNIAFTTLIPGPKMIWQFGEMGYDISIDSLGGRTNDKPSALGAQLNYLNVPARKAAYEAASKIITMRKNYPAAFNDGTAELNISYSDWNAGRRIAIKHADLNMVALGNFSATTAATTNPNFPKTGVWYELLTGEELTVTNTNMTINIPSGGVRIYTDRKVDGPKTGIENSDLLQEHTIYPTITTGLVFITSSSQNDISVYNMQGALVKNEKNVSEIDITDSSNGVYILKVSNNTGNSIHKVIKK
ncbi:MAG: alpha-amylase family glycosyl hydrolase, partial [Dysgonomonas sp.]